ncbi:MAG: hypothetical protein QG644_340 [Patescibacteria group bacterium]|nr:hypothetical protein [Patescibacteria group bacterium]
MKIYLLYWTFNHPFTLGMLILGLTVCLIAFVRNRRRNKQNKLPPVIDIVSDDGATKYVEVLAKKYDYILLGTRLAKGRLTTAGKDLIVLSDPSNAGVTEYESFENEPFYSVLVGVRVEGGKFFEKDLLVHKASGEFCLLDKSHPDVRFIPDDMQPFHMSFVDSDLSPDEEETRENGINEGAEYEGAKEGVKQNVKTDDDWDHHHASYP